MTQGFGRMAHTHATQLRFLRSHSHSLELCCAVQPCMQWVSGHWFVGLCKGPYCAMVLRKWKCLHVFAQLDEMTIVDPLPLPLPMADTKCFFFDLVQRLRLLQQSISLALPHLFISEWWHMVFVQNGKRCRNNRNPFEISHFAQQHQTAIGFWIFRWDSYKLRKYIHSTLSVYGRRVSMLCTRAPGENS